MEPTHTRSDFDLSPSPNTTLNLSAQTWSEPVPKNRYSTRKVIVSGTSEHKNNIYTAVSNDGHQFSFEIPEDTETDLDECIMTNTPTATRMVDSNQSISNEDTLNLSISMPYCFDDEDSDTPQPLDTPRDAQFDLFKYDHDNTENDELQSSQFSFESDELPPTQRPNLTQNSKSWTQRTMTSIKYKKCKKIKCITPISQKMAEMTINAIDLRRRSVANITPTIHKLFKLDPDLLKIREEYLEKNKSQSIDNDNDKCDELDHKFEKLKI